MKIDLNKSYGRVTDLATAYYGEHNDCSVRAATILTGLPYRVVHAECERAGRPARAGMYRRQLLQALRSLGAEVIPEGDPKCSDNLFKPGDLARRYSIATIGRAFPKGRYLITTRSHFAAMVDGVVRDWTAGRRHRVIWLDRIVPTTNRED